MRSFVITAPGCGEIRDVPVPEPTAGQVLLRIDLIGFCGSDLKTWTGANPLIQYPRRPGHEIAATIVAVGPEVPDDWQVGQAVTMSPYSNCGTCNACRRGRPNCCRNNETLGVQRDGALAEYVVAPHERLVRAPGLGPRELALVEPLTVGVHAAARGEVAAGDVAVVIGCGAVGLGAIAGAAANGAETVAVDIDAAKLALAERARARTTVNSRQTDLHEVLQNLTNGRGPDVIIEAVGLPHTFVQAVEEVAFAGRVVYIGYAAEPVTYQTKLFVQKELDIRGSRNAMPADFDRVVEILSTGDFPTEALISRTVPLEDAAAALDAWQANPAAITRILVQVSAEQGQPGLA